MPYIPMDAPRKPEDPAFAKMVNQIRSAQRLVDAVKGGETPSPKTPEAEALTEATRKIVGKVAEEVLQALDKGDTQRVRDKIHELLDHVQDAAIAGQVIRGLLGGNAPPAASETVETAKEAAGLYKDMAATMQEWADRERARREEAEAEVSGAVEAAKAERDAMWDRVFTLMRESQAQVNQLLQQAQEQRIAALTDQFSRQVEDLKQRFDQVIQAREQAHQEAVARIEAEYRAQLAERERDHVAALKDKEHDLLKIQLRSEHQDPDIAWKLAHVQRLQRSLDWEEQERLREQDRKDRLHEAELEERRKRAEMWEQFGSLVKENGSQLINLFLPGNAPRPHPSIPRNSEVEAGQNWPDGLGAMEA